MIDRQTGKQTDRRTGERKGDLWISLHITPIEVCVDLTIVFTA